MTPEQTKRAKAVIGLLIDAEPHPQTYTVSREAFLKSVARRIRAQYWQPVCDAINADPGLSAASIASRFIDSKGAVGDDRRPAVPVYERPASDRSALGREMAKRRINEIRQQLSGGDAA